MAFENKYGRISVEHEPGNPLGEDEPVFLLRARDTTSISGLIEYRRLCIIHNSPQEHIAALDQVLENFREWQNSNLELVKTPD